MEGAPISRGWRGAVLAIAGLLVLAPSHSAEADGPRLAVAAASDLQGVLPEIAARFERETGTTIALSFGSSGSFFAQIRNGAPFDVFFSADREYPARLVMSGDADGDALYQYATGRIVLWTRRDSGVDVAAGLAGLVDPRVRRIAIANPEHAPYGRAAVAALRHEKIYDAVRGKLVLGENISQAAQLAESGNADVGIVALSHALGPTLSASGTYFEIAASAHPPIDQAAVVLTSSQHKAEARALIAYLKRPDIRDLLKRFGFAVGH